MKPFDRSQTEKRTFYNHGNVNCGVSTEFISRWNHAYSISKPRNYGPKMTTIKILLKNNLSMIIFMPSTNQDMDQFMKELSPQFIEEHLEDLSFMSVKVVSIPKFLFSANFDVTENIGVEKHHPDEGVNLLISSATIKIDEEGNEGIPPEERYAFKNSWEIKPNVIVDRPFLFMIRDNFGLILFTGKINHF